MSKCKGLHCDGCNGGDGGGLIALLIAVAIITGVYRARHAIAATATAVLEIIGYTLAGLAAAAMLAGVVGVAVRVRRSAVRRALARSRAPLTRVVSAEVISPSARAGIDPPAPRIVARITDAPSYRERR